MEILLLQRSSKRNSAVCDAFFRQFVAVDHVQSREETGERPTYWPDVRASSELPTQSTCQDLLAHYDWEFASAQMSLHNLGINEGPYLVIYAPFGPTTASPGLVTASMNLSRFPDSGFHARFGYGGTWLLRILVPGAGFLKLSIYAKIYVISCLHTQAQ